MKRTILYSLAVIIISVFVGCTGKDKTKITPPSTEIVTIVAVLSDSNFAHKFMLPTKRQILLSQDSLPKIYYDSIYAYNNPVAEQVLDSLKRPVLDSLGKPKYQFKDNWLLINKKYVNWHIENISYDSLMKPASK